MGSVSDIMLASGVMPNLDALHGEQVLILDGVDAGKYFTAIKEHESDVKLDSDLMIDPRGRRMLRFTDTPGNVPSVGTKKLVKIQTGDGKKWSATRQDFGAYLSVDFELTEIAAGKDN
jgi:hypothetical protein